MSFFDDIANLVQQPPVAGLSASQQTAIDLNRDSGAATAAGEVIGGISHLQFGVQSKEAADFQAAQLRQNAGQAQASAQRTAADADLRTQMVNSAALASAAASGGGASDPTVVGIMARTAGEGAYRQAVALYQGDDRARLDDLQADAKTFEGANVKSNSALVAGAQFSKASTTLLGSAAKEGSMLQRFGMPLLGGGG